MIPCRESGGLDAAMVRFVVLVSAGATVTMRCPVVLRCLLSCWGDCISYGLDEALEGQ